MGFILAAVLGLFTQPLLSSRLARGELGLKKTFWLYGVLIGGGIYVLGYWLFARTLADPYGDIEIVYKGLGAGEKLYEELLIDAKAKTTFHPLIFRAVEKSIPYSKLMPLLEEMKLAIEENNKKIVFKKLTEILPEFKFQT